MSEKQSELLQRLCVQAGEPFWPEASYRHAWAMIANLQGALHPTRAKIVAEADCPRCGAVKGSACVDADGSSRTATHKARALALGGA